VTTGLEHGGQRAVRIAFVAESGTDVRIVEGLASRSRLTVLARNIPGGREISQPTTADFALHVGPASFARFPVFVARRLWALRREIDVVVVQGYGPAALAVNLFARASRTAAVMLVCSPVEAYYDCRRLDPDGRPFRRHERAVVHALAGLNARLGRHYVALSPYLASVIREHGSRASIDIVPVYGVDVRLFAPATGSRGALRRRLALPESASLVFFSSRIAPEKDPDTLLEAVRRLRADGRDVRVLHLSGAYRAFEARAAARGLSAAVVARDALAPSGALAEWYQASDVCVQASRAEGLGFSVLESLACEVPVVAAAVGGLCDTVVEPDTGWRYAPGDPGSLARALADVLDRPDEGASRARRGRAMVIERYETGAVFAQLLAVLRRLSAVPPGEAA
jgi:glycosyltransferase involved in cell wall biosynthesis